MNELLTNRELAEWLAKGNGEYNTGNYSGWRTTIQINFVYMDNEWSNKVDGDIRVRKWEDEEWHRPTYEYCGMEKKL